MSSGTTTQTRKFQFFDEIIEDNNSTNISNPNKIIETKDKEKENENENTKKLNISLSSVVPIKDMQVLDGVIFMCASVIYKETKKKNTGILKIVNSQVIDEYFMSNKYYDYIIMKYMDKPYLIIFGSMMQMSGDVISQYNSIKFYRASEFIEKKEERYPVKEIKEIDENYPDLLQREIKLYKKGNSNSNIICETENNKNEGLNKLENCIGLAVDPSLTYAAIALEKGQIVIISAFPNLLDCKGKKMKTTLLTLPEKDGPYLDITNIKFGDLYSEGEKKILYVSTKNYLAYYEWSMDEKVGDNLDMNTKCNFFSNISSGALEGCLCAKRYAMLVASSDEKCIYEFFNRKLNKLEKDELGNIKKTEKGKRNGELAFEGPKKNVSYFNNNLNEYIIYQIPGKTYSTIHVYDNVNNFFVFIKTYSKKILSICSDSDYIYVFVEENESKKYMVKLVEKENKKKFDIFFSRKLYDIAADYAKYLQYDDKKLTEIYKLQAEFEYSRGDFNKSIEAYINTINYIDPSIIIQKFLTKSKMDVLIKYLEAIENNITFKQRSLENYKNYTTLLLNCYLMKEDKEITKLKDFIEKKKDSISPEILRTVIDVCLDIQSVDLALSIAKSKEMYEDYIQILILKQNKFQEALDFIYSDNEEKDKQSKLNIKEQTNLFCKFGENFLKSDIKKIFFQRVKKFLGQNNSNLDKEEKQKLLEIFISNDDFYRDIYQLMDNYGLELDKNMLHRRIELYLEEINGKEKILEIIQNKNNIGLYDNEYLMMLFKHKNFSDGIEALSKLTNQRHELLSIYIQKRDYPKIINLCETYGDSEKSFWGIALNFFVDKSVRENLDKNELEDINQNLQKFLDLILEKKAMLPVNILDIINEKNDEIPLNILRKFIDNSLEEEIKPLDIKVAKFDDYNNQLKSVNNKIKEIQTQASSVKLSKCEICYMGITFPAICFRCGHCYHSMCLNANDDNDLDDVDCPKCEEEKETTKQKMLELKSIYEDVNSKEKLKNTLDYNTDKFEFIHSLYGRGIINIGPAYDDYSTNEIKEALSLIEDNTKDNTKDKTKENNK
jgi:hypothetical protein